ncbi:MAG TPA: carboxypeptidase-like regulatory domain-containing protein [Terracidiphilus sp.]|nr:carboxypeptidase-like regulatory domain-containing protein [Terracidiphilus sp.]
MSRPHLALFAALIALGSASVYGAAPGTVTGVVCDSSGMAQIGAEVELLRPDLTVIATVYTNSTGHYSIPSVRPGRYAVKALGTSFLPSLREDVRVRSSAVVNLTLNTLYEVMQWLPSEPRAANAEQDDWKWTLRSAANRPLLRWLEDGPLVVVSDGSAGSHKLKARLVATGQQGTFGESGERVSAAVEETPANSRELLAQVDFAPGSDAGLESMLGFRQDLGFAGSVESVAAVAIHPEINAGGSYGLDEAAIRSWETMELGDEWQAEVGSTQVLARFAGNSPNTIAAALPFARVAWRDGDSTVHYRMATAVPASPDIDDTQAQAWLPALSMRNGQLAMEHGLHQEIGWERRTEDSAVSVVVFSDRMDNPVMEAAYRPVAGTLAATSGAAQLLMDPASGLVRAAGPGFSTAGVVATVERRLPAGHRVRVSYANGNALVLAAPSQPATLVQLLGSARPRHAQTYSISLSGTIDGSGTRWRATYRWQPEATVTSVASFSQDAADPYLNFQMRQPIHIRGDGAGGFEAVFNLRNLLAQGYRPYLLSDGSLLVFAQDQRGISGGLAFNF